MQVQEQEMLQMLHSQDLNNFHLTLAIAGGDIVNQPLSILFITKIVLTISSFFIVYNKWSSASFAKKSKS